MAKKQAVVVNIASSCNIFLANDLMLSSESESFINVHFASFTCWRPHYNDFFLFEGDLTIMMDPIGVLSKYVYIAIQRKKSMYISLLMVL